MKTLDKAKKKAKITVKVGGKKVQPEESVKVHDWKAAEETAAAQEDSVKEEESFEWVLPELDADQIEEFRPIHYTPAPKKKSIFPKKAVAKRAAPAILFSVVSAVVFGALLGFVVLKFIAYGDHQTKLPKQQAEGAAAGTAQQEAQLPALSIGIIQAGVFSTEGAASKVSRELAAKKVPSMQLSMDGQRYIFAGVADSLGTAKKMETAWKDKGVELYAKEISFSSKKVQTTTKDEQIFARETVPLFQKLAKETAAAVQNGRVSPDGMKTAETAAGNVKKLAKVRQETLGRLKKYETAAYESLVAYQKSGNRQDLTDAEQNLLDYVKVYSGH
ncbi:hypothetical protein [Heyndrickxia coagulans]|uniref:hypothetical protein n=1 Tax=Heyndrickxia coagulans TaxID=1398 RepID=UPI001F334BCB|nr:hypothetical protein [Heyndrickxia coagulans]